MRDQVGNTCVLTSEKLFEPESKNTDVNLNVMKLKKAMSKILLVSIQKIPKSLIKKARRPLIKKKKESIYSLCIID